ncbi:MAG: hypothetical protein ACK4R6_12855 [Spirosomataceae bacterium]
MSKRIIGFLGIFLVLCMSGCSDSPLGQPDLSGTWELKKIVYGFTQITNDSPPKETIVISLRQKSIKRYEEDKLVEDNRLSLSTRNERAILVLQDTQEYYYYQLLEINGKTQLVLYEKTPIGYDIADGADYYYERK